MSIERIFHCDGPDCSGHIRTAADFPSSGFIRTYERWPGDDEEHHFCTWECVLRYAAAREPVEVIAARDLEDETD